MMLTIHGLPRTTKYHDLKVLIKRECNITDFILDNLVAEGDGLKKVRIGLTDENEGGHVIKCLDGYRMSGHILRVVPVGKTVPMNAPHGVGYNQPINNYPNQSNNSYGNHPMEPAASRPAPWGPDHNQWPPSQPMASQVPQNVFGLQQQTQMPNNPYVQQQAPQPSRPDLKPFGPREVFPQGRAPPQEAYGFPSKHLPDPKMNQPQQRMVSRSHALRSVEIIETPFNRSPAAPSRYPPANQAYDIQEKPMTIMKSNFQGPQYDMGHQANQPHFQGQGQTQPPSWPQHGQQQKPQSFSKPSPNTYDKMPYIDERKYPQSNKRQEMLKAPQESRSGHDNYKSYEKGERNFSPPRRNSPYRRKDSPPGRMVSPGRRLSPPRRRISPPERRISPPGRRVSSPGRRISPPGRRISPSDRRISPLGRRISPNRMPMRHSPSRREPSPRRMAAHKRGSPDRRPGSPIKRGSPGRRDSPPGRNMRYSPPRRHPDKSSKYNLADGGQSSTSKQVRPAYEPLAQAPNQPMYSGGYRPNVHENVQYPIPGMRPVDQRNSPWQQDRDKAMFAPMKKESDDRRDVSRLQSFEMPRGSELKRVLNDQTSESKRVHSPTHKSRSPVRRERSPVRDRYKRHSPSPRSPRRSWALEKRRSPEIREAPPPPIWPGQNVREDQYQRENRPNFTEKIAKEEKRMTVWDHSSFEEKHDRRRDGSHREVNEQLKFDNNDQIRVRRDLGPRQPMLQPSRKELSPGRHTVYKSQGESFPQNRKQVTRFSSRDDIVSERHSDDFRRQDNVSDRKPYSDRPGFNIPEKNTYSNFRDFPQRSSDHGDHNRQGDFQQRKEEFPHHPEERRDDFRKREEFRKDFRTQEFHRKGEEFRKGEERRREDYSREDHIRPSETKRQFESNFDQRHKHHQREDETRNRDYRDEISRHDFRPNMDSEHDQRPLSRHSDQFRKHSREPEWNTEENVKVTKGFGVKQKREKAVEEIAQNIFKKNGLNLKDEQQKRIFEELKLSLSRIMVNMFRNEDVSFIEMVIKFNAKYDGKGEAKILEDVMSSFPSQYRHLKRQAADSSEIPAKTFKRSSDLALEKDVKSREANQSYIPDWNLNLEAANIANMQMQMEVAPQMPVMMNTAPFMVPMSTIVPAFEEMSTDQYFSKDSNTANGFNLYLCKDNFETFTDIEAENLKSFLVSQIFRVTETSQGWAPDVTLKGLQSRYRYELLTMDESSKDWLVDLDFSEFTHFNVLVYTKEELWYERAAIWLPGHSRFRNIDPMAKLKLQNKKLEGVNIGKWKCVKKIVTAKGTRLYVDMPPSSARALEKHKMMLSYELQKVNVFLKAVAIDKDAFDAGLNEPSISDPSEIVSAAQNSPMPSLSHDPNIVKIALKGNKNLTILQARKIKEMVIYHIFKHLQEHGNSSTDFVKYGYCSPGYFGVLPENAESKKWLQELNIGKLNRHAIVVLEDDNNVRYIKMTVIVPNEYNISSALIQERIKQKQQGVKGLNFHKWKPIQLINEKSRVKLEIDMDVESVETISKMKFRLDYEDGRHTVQFAQVRCEHSKEGLDELISKYKAESKDSYDVANMDIASSDSDEDVVYLG